VGNELELREAASMDRLSKSGRRTLQRPDTSQWIEQHATLKGNALKLGTAEQQSSSRKKLVTRSNREVRLKDRVAIVTGAGSGIGRGIAIRFSEEGAKIVVADKTSISGEETARMIRARGGEAIFVLTDVTSGADIQRMVQTARDQFGRLDTLVNNAGISPNGSVTEIDEDEWDLALNVDLKSVFLGCKYAIPVMIESGGGSIVNIAGTLGFMAMPRKAAYCAAKAGVINLTRQMAIDYGPRNVRINCICPGFVDTPLNAGYTEEQRREELDKLPISRAGQTDDIAKAALYLASDESAYVTGSRIIVDGGQTLSILGEKQKF
jgi:NAD(P)-dependent dehydrogenase (short-subunit alcohol dehydrogenase family)